MGVIICFNILEVIAELESSASWATAGVKGCSERHPELVTSFDANLNKEFTL